MKQRTCFMIKVRRLRCIVYSIDIRPLCTGNLKFPERLQRPGLGPVPLFQSRSGGVRSNCGQWRGNFRNLKDARPRNSPSALL